MVAVISTLEKRLPVVLVGAGLALIGLAAGPEVVRAGSAGGFGLKQSFALVGGIVLLASAAVRAVLPGCLDRLAEVAAFRLERSIAILGGVNLAGYCLYAVLSYGMAPLPPLGASQIHNAAFFDRIAGMVSFLGSGAQAFVRGQSPIADPAVFFVLYSLPVVISSLVLVVLLVMLAGRQGRLPATTPRHLVRWAVAFAAVSVLASPVLVHDFWYPLAWGRMLSAGVNPYYFDLTQEFTFGLPLNVVHERMMYGPVLGAVSGAVMWLVGGDAIQGAIAFKLMLGGAWIGSLMLIWSLLRGRSIWHQCAGIAIFGWMPLSVMQAVADGHNDIFMVLLVLLWLRYLGRGNGVRASVFLAASVLTKYITAPLFLLDVLSLRGSQGRIRGGYLTRALVAGAFAAAVFGIFFRSMDFFAPIVPRTTWHFYSPREAVLALQLLVGFSLDGLPVVAIRLFFPVVALYAVLLYLREPVTDRFHDAVLAILAAVLFGYISGLWPWYLVWVLAGAALVPGSLLGRWIAGVALASPFPLLVWVTFPTVGDALIFDYPALALYLFPLIWLLFMPRSLFPRSDTDPVPNERSLAVQPG